ncbi:PilT/PilU family type 4a pilus ATPase [Candidatus Bipolaricaulota bacterium]|nr:PilT/PilU family type 4a pilus ATPase [Candidatus Bipolaricaulota bacterium]
MRTSTHNGGRLGYSDGELNEPARPRRRSEVQDILALAHSKDATDVHIVAGSPILFRIEGELVPVTRDRLSPALAKRLGYSILTSEQIARFESDLEFDLMMSEVERGRYRVNLSFINGNIATVIRLLPSKPVPLDELRLPPVVARLPRARKGLVLITGSTSQGKTTTLASIVDAINRECRRNVITIEDPVEYVHSYKHSSIRQRQVGRDTVSFARGLRAALRQDPDVIAIGEMRDYETIRIALTAAATGVLVLSTLHVISIDKIIERLLAYAPEGTQAQTRTLLSEALLCVLHQELLPTVDGNKRVACEVLVATDAVRNLIRNRGTFFLRSVIATGRRFGMQTMKASLAQLREEGEITNSLYRLILQHYP